MRKVIAICGALFDGASDVLHGPTEILIEGDTISDSRPLSAGQVARKLLI